jgi:hypothetical protein
MLIPVGDVTQSDLDKASNLALECMSRFAGPTSFVGSLYAEGAC